MLQMVVRRSAILAMMPYIALALAGCSWKDPEETISYQSFYYSFNSQTILDTIDVGQGLQLEAWKIPPTPPPSPASVNWSQDDFYRVALALVPPDLASRTYLYGAQFWIDCQHVEQGITRMSFDMSTHLDRQHSQIRSDLGIIVNAREGWASVSRDDKSPGVFSYKPSDFPRMKVSAAQALRLAEDLAGSAYRQKVGNQCDIFGLEAGEYWWLMYSEPVPNTPPGLEIHVFQSGEAKIFRQRK